MEKRYSDILTNRLETVMDEGCAHVLKSELHRWYGRQRIAARTYRDIEERWLEITSGEAGQLNKVRGASGFFLIRGDRLGLIAEEAEED